MIILTFNIDELVGNVKFLQLDKVENDLTQTFMNMGVNVELADNKKYLSKFLDRNTDYNKVEFPEYAPATPGNGPPPFQNLLRFDSESVLNCGWPYTFCIAAITPIDTIIKIRIIADNYYISDNYYGWAREITSTGFILESNINNSLMSRMIHLYGPEYNGQMIRDSIKLEYYCNNSINPNDLKTIYLEQ